MVKKLFMIIMLSSLVCIPGCWQDTQQEEKPAAEPVEQRPGEKSTATQPASKKQARVVSLDEFVTKGQAADMLRSLVAEGDSVVDFYADWCGPCKKLLPVLKQVSAEHENIRFLKVNVDTFNNLADGFNIGDQRVVIRGIPAVYLIRDGKIVDSFTGGLNKKALNEKLQKAFK